MTDLKKYIFIDLDDTLTHSILVSKDYCKKNDRTLIEVKKSECSEYDEYYAALLKKNTHLLLGYLRSKYDRVILLTMATKPYARKYNEVFSLGFFDWDVLDRRDVHSLTKFTDEVFIGVLLDNLPKSDPNTWRKLQLIAHHARDMRYRHFHMRTFEGHSEHSFLLDSGNQSIKTLDWHINYELSL